MFNLDLDVPSPDRVAHVLRKTANVFHDSSIELSAAWQDNSGQVWVDIARILERAALACDKACSKHGV